MMGGALGLAVLASIAAARTDSLRPDNGPLAALLGGYHVAFVVGAVFAAAAVVVGTTLLRTGQQAAVAQRADAMSPATE